MRRRRTLRNLIVASVSVLLIATAGTARAGTPDRATITDHPTAAGTPASAHIVTLLTGDQVVLSTLPDGRAGVAVTPGPGRTHVAFERRTDPRTRHLIVLPEDAAALVAADRPRPVRRPAHPVQQNVVPLATPWPA